MISHPCALVLLAMFGSDMYEPWNLECELTHVCHSSSLYRRPCMTDLKKQNKKKQNMHPCVIHCERFLCPSRGHRSCQLLIFLKATKHTPECVCVCVRVSVCVRLYRCRAVEDMFGTKRIAAGAVWSAVISCEEAETLKVTTAAPLMPVNVTEARAQSLLGIYVFASGNLVFKDFPMRYF